MTRIVYVYSELPNYVRVKKNIFQFSKNFDEVVYIGANRSNTAFDKSEFPENVMFSIYQKQIRHGGFGSIFDSIGFAKFVFANLKLNKYDVIVFVNEELLWLTSFIKIDTKTKIIVEILDSLAIRLLKPLSHLNFLFRTYCNFYYKRCHSLIEVSEHRRIFRKYLHSNVIVIPNRPVSTTISSWFPEILNDIKYIYVSGSVIPGVSGIETLLKAFELMPESNLKIVYSGRLHSDWATKVFFSQPYVINLGNLSPEQSLCIAKRSECMFAYYKDINFNYKLASPNKVSDSLFTGKPILMNSECEAKLICKRADLLYEAKYNDAKLLAENIISITNLNQQEKDEMKLKANTIFAQEYSDEVIDEKWIQVFNDVFE